MSGASEVASSAPCGTLCHMLDSFPEYQEMPDGSMKLFEGYVVAFEGLTRLLTSRAALLSFPFDTQAEPWPGLFKEWERMFHDLQKPADWSAKDGEVTK